MFICVAINERTKKLWVEIFIFDCGRTPKPESNGIVQRKHTICCSFFVSILVVVVRYNIQTIQRYEIALSWRNWLATRIAQSKQRIDCVSLFPLFFCPIRCVAFGRCVFRLRLHCIVEIVSLNLFYLSFDPVETSKFTCQWTMNECVCVCRSSFNDVISMLVCVSGVVIDSVLFLVGNNWQLWMGAVDGVEQSKVDTVGEAMRWERRWNTFSVPTKPIDKESIEVNNVCWERKHLVLFNDVVCVCVVCRRAHCYFGWMGDCVCILWLSTDRNMEHAHNVSCLFDSVFVLCTTNGHGTTSPFWTNSAK